MTSQDQAQDTATKPFEKHRDGALECAIWRRETDKGVLYNTELKRSYRDDQGNWQSSHAIPDRDLLKAARLQEQAYGSIQKARAHDRSNYVERQKAQTQPDMQRAQEPTR